MSDSNIRWKRSVAGNRIGYVLERYSHNGPPHFRNIDGEAYLVSKPIWVPVTMQNEDGGDTDTTLFVGTGEFINTPDMGRMGPANAFEVTLDTVENFEDVVDD